MSARSRRREALAPLPPAGRMTAEQFIRLHATKAMIGAVASTVVDLDGDAVDQALALGRAGLPYTGTVRVQPDADGEAQCFEVTYECRGRRLVLRETVREVRGTWKITSIEKRT
jgi:hypothetical protein